MQMTKALYKEKLVLEPDGSILLPAAFLAEQFGWPVARLQGLMRRGLVQARVEQGIGEDAGRWRLSVRSGNRRWQAIVDANGNVLEHDLEVLTVARR